MPSEIKPGVYWVGAVDWGLRHFHGFELSTHRGSSYNAYLIMDEKVAVVDTVWSPFTDEFMKNVREIIDPSRIDYVVVNHSEMDHSGALPELLRAAPQAEVLVSKRGLDSVPGHFHEGWTLRAVQNGETLSLGAHELVFVDAPMLHWPDSMFTYVTGHNLLLPNDAFGQHYATAFRFNDQVDNDELYYEALKYYANILTPYSDRVLKKIDELLALGLPVDMIAPSHGVIWRQDPLQIVTRYQEWARQAPARRAVVIHDTMWEATRRMAEAISKGLSAEGVPHRLCHIPVTDENDILAEVFQSGAVLFGSPTLNRGILPSLAPLLEQMHGLGFKNKVGAAFGSYGWGGEAVRRIEEQLERANVTLVAKGVRAKWQPTESDLAACEALGREVAAALPPADG